MQTILWRQGPAQHSVSAIRRTEAVHIDRFRLIRILVSLIAGGVVWFRVWEPIPRFSFIGIAAVIFAGWPIFSEAFDGLGKRKVTMELSITIALCMAAAIGEVFTALMIAVLVLTAEIVARLSVSSLQRAAGHLWGGSASHTRPETVQIQQRADRLAEYLVYCALGGAAITFIFTRDLLSTISVLIVAGVGGVVVGTPLALLSTMACAANEGVVIKSREALEQLWEIDTVLLNKTGTLTDGKRRVCAITPAPGHEIEEVLFLAASVEKNSMHSIARAITAASQVRQVPSVEPHDVRYIPGKGVCGLLGSIRVDVGNRALMGELQIELPRMAAPTGTRVFIARDYRFVGWIDIEDVIREGAGLAVSEMQKMGLEVELITADTPAAAAWIAESLGIEEISGGLLPEQKIARVEELVRRGRIVAMIGDGIDDAPALARASVGTTMGESAEALRESAKVLLIGNDLDGFTAALKLARRCRDIVFQNFWGTVIVDAVGIVLAASGVLNPLVAAVIHVCSEVMFMLRSNCLKAHQDGTMSLAMRE